jgi:hypothetical protein
MGMDGGGGSSQGDLIAYCGWIAFLWRPDQGAGKMFLWKDSGRFELKFSKSCII